MPLFSSAKPYKGQKYSELKKECQQHDCLFIDTEFPPEDKSIFKTQEKEQNAAEKQPKIIEVKSETLLNDLDTEFPHEDTSILKTREKIQNAVWKRPKQICDNPKLFVSGASPGNVSQGHLGNCWFVAACSCLALYKEIWSRVVPNYDQQEWNDAKPEEYRGIFHFQFWRYGYWLDVVIDDLLPTANDELIFIHSQSPNEFWSALLEKAYAKLFGSYEALEGVELNEALEDFTGGVSEAYNLVQLDVANNAEEREVLFKRMIQEFNRKSLMTAAIPPKSKEEMEVVTPSGLVTGHAYGVTDVKLAGLEGTGTFGIFNRETLPMVRLRNPWGQGEWKGAFSDRSPEWNKISASERRKMGLVFNDDREFWMSFDDYCTHFHTMLICHIVNTSLLSCRKTWNEGSAHGMWVKPNRAGGCFNNHETFVNNPQYMFDVITDEDEVMIQVTQKSSRTAQWGENMTIGFSVIKVEENRRFRLKKIPEVLKSSVFKNSRAVFLRHTLGKGRYVVIPCTKEPDHEGEFLLRIYTDRANSLKKLVLDRPIKAWYNCCSPAVSMVSQLKVIRVDNLECQDQTRGADPYFIVSCEGEKVHSKVIKDSLSPEWNTSVIFYRKKPTVSPIKIQIWNSNTLKDEFLGQHIFMSTEECQDKVVEVDLFGRKNENRIHRPGKLVMQVTTTCDVSSI